MSFNEDAILNGPYKKCMPRKIPVGIGELIINNYENKNLVTNYDYSCYNIGHLSPNYYEMITKTVFKDYKDI